MSSWRYRGRIQLLYRSQLFSTRDREWRYTVVSYRSINRSIEKQDRTTRVNIMRYIVVSYVLVFRDVCERIRLRFPTLKHLKVRRDQRLNWRVIAAEYDNWRRIEDAGTSKWWVFIPNVDAYWMESQSTQEVSTSSFSSFHMISLPSERRESV